MPVMMDHVGPIRRDRKFWLVVECTTLFLGVPMAIAAGWLRVQVIPLLLLMAAGCGLVLQRVHKIQIRRLFSSKISVADWRRILIAYSIAVPFLAALLWIINPSAMWSLMCQHTKIWLLVMVAYPVVSVFPQELIYRAFFFERYRPLFERGAGIVLASAAIFSFGHVVFHNWPAAVLTFVGGLLFARTYQQTSSLLLVSVEHALYGCAIFTIGYGSYFFDGTMRLIR
jgi:membrane protease YdiL (CAAX protease family)